MNRKELELLDELLKGLKDIEKIGNNKLVTFLLSLPKDKLVEEIRELDDETVLTICENIAMEREAYEICEAAQIVKAERGLE
jgi:hypothetical protein